MKIEVRIEVAIRTRICKVQRLFRIHCNKDLNQREKSCEDTFMSILLNLIHSLSYRNTGFLQFNMENRHAIDQKHEITTAILQDLFMSRKDRLLYYLITAFPASNFHTIIDPETYFLTIMQGIIRILSDYGNSFSINKSIQCNRSPAFSDLLQEFIHLLRNKRTIIKPVNISVILKKDIRPVPDQILFGRILNYLLLPAITL